MTSEGNKHQKHSKLERPKFGEFHRLEFGFIGAPCGEIQRKINEINAGLIPARIAYIDADHASGDDASNPDYACYTSFTDKITYRSLQTFKQSERFDHQLLFNDHDLVLINGNHFHSSAQIIVCHPGKLESLQRKLKRIDNVQLILLAGGISEVPEFLKIHLGRAFDESKVGKWDDLKFLLNFIRQKLKPAPLKALILAGGKSTRMGSDKTVMEYHGVPQREYLYQMIESHSDQTFISVRSDQSTDSTQKLHFITDKFLGLGPYGAILSAFQQDPNAAWLVIASDLPLFDEESLLELISARDPYKVATAFRSPTLGFPEPLVSIWEPKAYFHLLRFMGLGYSCPRKVLINTDTRIIEANRPETLRNVNTKEDFKEVMKLLADRN